MITIEPRYLLAPTIFASFIFMSYILYKVKLLPHLSDSGSRYQQIDGLRGIAAVCVICAHSWRVTMSGVTNDEIFKQDMYYHANLGAIGVQMFFCITGFLFFNKIIRDKNINWNSFFISRIKRLVPLYAFVCSIIAVTMLFMINFHIDSNFLFQTVKVFSFGFYGTKYNIDGHELGHSLTMFWTLTYEWKFYFFLPLVAACMSNKKIKNIFILISIIWLIVFLFHDKGVLYNYFLTGGLCAYIKNKFNPSENRAFTFIFVAAVIVNLLSIYINDDPYSILRYVLSSVLFFSVIFASPKILKVNALRFLGEISYSTYLTHAFLFYFCGEVIKKVINLGDSSVIVTLSIAVIMSFFITLISSLTFKYIEHPFIKK